ncbi:MAG TPA: hypothetical protein VH092_17270 [Urbifossiella sp.]|nr:hypothetical protein [Urbifossiella sp.]
MNEAKWLAAERPAPLLRFAWDLAGERKRRLFAAACCRRVAHLFSAAPFRAAVTLAERVAAGRADEAAGREAALAALRGVSHGTYRSILGVGVARALADPLDYPQLHAAAANLAAGVAWRKVPAAAPPEPQYGGTTRTPGSPDPRWRRVRDEELRWQAAVLRDIVGNPFRRLVTDPSWITSTVTLLAVGISEDGAFDRLTVLADALQDAGCEEEQLLGHLRGPGPHVCGCWVVDALFGKADALGIGPPSPASRG